jgi:hypothetical protein
MDARFASSRAARAFAHDDDWIVAEVDAFGADVVGIALFTRWVWPTRTVSSNDCSGRVLPLLVAGSAHDSCGRSKHSSAGSTSWSPAKRETIVHLVDAVIAGRPLSEVPGILYRDRDGTPRNGACARPISDLDTLAFPQLAQGLYDRFWYDPSGSEIIPGGILTSRGCPARCTFCANYVTGRKFRHRGAECVIEELNAYHELTGVSFFPCWDDALTADRPRLIQLCETIERGVRFPFTWSAITRAPMVTPELLAAMRRAGLMAVNFGVESGDDQILRAIKKGITTDHVVRALEWAKAEGLRTACNFMLGFPQETPDALDRTLRFMERIAPLVDAFSTMGVLVPFPGTPLYEDYHAQFGFTEWWLRESFSSAAAIIMRTFQRALFANSPSTTFPLSHEMRDRCANACVTRENTICG